MSTETQSNLELDDTAQAWLLAYKDANDKIAELEEKRAVARQHLEQALGDAETALIGGQPVLRWSFVETKRFDTKKAREILPAELIAALETSTQSRRFSLVKED